MFMRPRKKLSPRFFALLLPAFGGAAAPPLHADGGVPGWNALVYLVYRLEVTRYCSVADDAVAAGFRAARDALVAQYRLAAGLIESARHEAYLLAYREWQNRGLGGFRRWCRVDAALFARQLSAPETISQPGVTP
ncbi:MAG: hypothetical protein MPJ83_08075 [Gammaproteobacteria bacterium]|nr:hypothetical protein [Gammaproteobacteria bacterium]